MDKERISECGFSPDTGKDCGKEDCQLWVFGDCAFVIIAKSLALLLADDNEEEDDVSGVVGLEDTVHTQRHGEFHTDAEGGPPTTFKNERTAESAQEAEL